MGLPIPDPVQRDYGSIAEFAAAIVTVGTDGYIFDTATVLPDQSVKSFWVKPAQP
jgi:hypothetical protein